MSTIEIQTLGGHKQNLMWQDPGERNSDPTGDLLVDVWGAPVKAWVGGGL